MNHGPFESGISNPKPAQVTQLKPVGSLGRTLAHPSHSAHPPMDIPRSAPPKKNKRLYYVGGGVAALVAITFTLGSLKTAAPSVDRSTVWIDTVQKGEMLRAVQGEGQLVPEDIRWITARTAARVERIVVRPGAPVKADTELLVLSNPDVELQSLEADHQASQAESELANLKATLQRELFAQQSAVASLKSDLGDAQRRAKADEDLAKRGFLSSLELGQSRSKAEDLASRLAFEQKRLAAMGEGENAQIAAARANVDRMKQIAEFRKTEVEGLHVRAGIDGVLEELPLQVGQTVQPGAEIAKVARPDKLMAEVKVPETLTRDLAIGQQAEIDTHVGVVKGRVSRIDPSAQAGTVKVDVTLQGALPQGARPDQTVEGTIELERISNAIYVGRPSFGSPGSTITLFKLAGAGDEAIRVPVKLGRASVKTVEVLDGLRPGDRVVLSDMSAYDHDDRIRLH
jgi:HlyD family secretion protein